MYAGMAYAVTSFVQFQPMWEQCSEGEDPEALSLSSPLCAAPVDLPDPPHLQVLHGMVWLAKVGCNWFFCCFFLLFFCSYVRAVSVYPVDCTVTELFGTIVFECVGVFLNRSFLSANNILLSCVVRL